MSCFQRGILFFLVLSLGNCYNKCGAENNAINDSGHTGQERSKEGQTHNTGDNCEVVDPYCGVRFPRKESAGTFQFQGKTYYFCLTDHKIAFSIDPEKYLRDAGQESFGNCD